MSQVVEAPVEAPRRSTEDDPVEDRPWVVIVWNDPINLMSYVTLVLQQLFGYSRARATKPPMRVVAMPRPPCAVPGVSRDGTMGRAPTAITQPS